MLRFSLRELLLLMLIAAIGVGWWRDRQSLQIARKINVLLIENQRLERQIEQSKKEIASIMVQ